MNVLFSLLVFFGLSMNGSMNDISVTDLEGSKISITDLEGSKISITDLEGSKISITDLEGNRHIKF